MLNRGRCYQQLVKLLLLGVFFWAPAGAETRDPESFFFDESFGQFDEELERAQEEGKKGVLIMFQQEECPYCHRMRESVLNQKKVQDYYRQHFLVFQVDIEGELEITDFSGQHTLEKDFAFKQNRVRATPVFAFFDLNGARVARYTGATTDVDEFLLLARYVVNEEFRSMSFNRYKRQQ